MDSEFLDFDENILVLKDVKTIPDVVQEYTKDLRGQPLIIDNGSFQCRVGFANKKTPQMIFKNLVCKPRKDRNKKETKEEIQQQAPPATLIGNDIVNIEALRFQLRTQFDKNVVTHFYLQEQVFDYIFTHLGINTENQINHPLVMTEAMVNPNYSRSLMSELLFECYQVPSVFYGTDGLFSFSYNENIKGTALIISLGYHTTHVIPFVNGHQVTDKIRRINVGGFHMLTYIHRLMQLKYPMHVNNITLSRIEELFHEHCFIAKDYIGDLKQWACHDYYDRHIKKVQLPYTQTVAPTQLTAEQKVEKKKEMSRRLAEINARKREERLVEEEDQLQRFEEILESFDDEDTEEFEMGLKEFNLTSYEELEKTILATKARIEKIKTKMQAAESGVIEEKPVVIPQPPVGMNIDEWLNQVREKKNTILEKKQVRKQRRLDLAKRRTAAAQERMRIISRLAGKEKGTDDFGSRDSDWNVYKIISREQDSDSEVENEKLLELDEILRHHDPILNDDEKLKMTPAEYHQLHFSVESIRGPELLFQPSAMIGICEAGLAEAIDYVLKLFPQEDQQRLVDNIFITGGISSLPGLKERLLKELLEMRPFQSTFDVKIAKDPSLDCWNGMKKFAASEKDVNSFSINKQEYFEHGGEFIKEHCLSNRYYKTPLEKSDNPMM